MEVIDIESKFSKHFDWHFDPLKKDHNDCPDLGVMPFDYKSLSSHFIEKCSSQDRKANGKGWDYYFENGNLRQDIIESKSEGFQELFQVWLDTGWTHENSCYFEFWDEDLEDFYQPLLDAYFEFVGELKHTQIRLFIKPPMTTLGLHADTYNSYCRKHSINTDQVFRVQTFVEDWEWGHYNLIGNHVCHQYNAGQSQQIKQNVFHLSGNFGFNPMCTMNITGVKT